MTDYTDLISRLRNMLHNETIKDRFYAIADASDAIDLLQRELKCANELWEQQKELALEYLADIAELEAALKPFADASDVHLGSDDMSIAFRIIIGNLRQARKVLGEKE